TPSIMELNNEEVMAILISKKKYSHSKYFRSVKESKNNFILENAADSEISVPLMKKNKKQSCSSYNTKSTINHRHAYSAIMKTFIE
ncbi:hypothetical protein HZS_2672, partial [Henneguya salminicola]